MRLSLLPSLVLAGLFAPAAELSFHPEEGSELSKAFQTEIKIQLDDLRVDVDGEEIDPAMFLPGTDLDSLNAELTLRLEVLDHYKKMATGRPAELLRTFEAIRASGSTGLGQSMNEENEDSLSGKSVLFTWNEEESAFDRKFEGDEGDAEELPRLAEDMDLRGLLPAGDVESWSVLWRDYPSLIIPGYDAGTLSMEDMDLSGSDGPPAEVVEAFLTQLREVFSNASLECTLNGEREIDGRKCAIIALESSHEGTLDLASVLASALTDMPEGVDIQTLAVDISFELNGEFTWDLEAGHFHSFDLGGEFLAELGGEITFPEEMGGASMNVTVEASGEVLRTARLE